MKAVREPRLTGRKRPVEFGALPNRFRTDLNSQFEMPFRNLLYVSSAADLDLIPAKLDALPEGIFGIYSDSLFNSRLKRAVTIGSNTIGRTVSTDSLRKPELYNPDHIYGSSSFSARTRQRITLYSLLGFTLSGDKAVAIPTPETIQSAAQDVGVKTRLFADHGQIPGKLYLKSFRDGYYPISTYGEKYYGHDIVDDHIAAMMLGGESLKSALQEAAGCALKSGSLGTATDMIDTYTANLRKVTGVFEARKPADFMEILLLSGDALGISEKQTNKILSESKDRARREFDIEMPAGL